MEVKHSIEFDYMLESPSTMEDMVQAQNAMLVGFVRQKCRGGRGAGAGGELYEVNSYDGTTGRQTAEEIRTYWRKYKVAIGANFE